MIKLKFIPAYFPWTLLPLYWIFFISFYILYLPCYLLVWIFSPYRSDKSYKKYYSRKMSQTKRNLKYLESEDKENGTVADKSN